jgi:hypothetical protein
MQGSESFGDRGRSLIEPGRDERSGFGVGRFGIAPQLMDILVDTARYSGWLTAQPDR